MRQARAVGASGSAVGVATAAGVAAVVMAAFGAAACSGARPIPANEQAAPPASVPAASAMPANDATSVSQAEGAAPILGAGHGVGAGGPPTNGGTAPAASTARPAAPVGPSAETRCTERPAQEEPVHEGTMGEGDRVIRIFNRTGVPVRLRLLGNGEDPVLEGTLHISKGAQGELRVGAGSYRVRYRLESSCEVLRGSPIALTGNRAGVEIQLRAGGSGAGSGSVEHVGDAL